MKESETNYYAIIPANVRYCKRLTANAKLLYGEITALCNKEGYCWASNKYFAELYKVSNTSVSLWIKSLKDQNFIRYEIKRNYMRKIFLKGVLDKSKGGIKKSERGVLRKVKDNNTFNNKTNITNKDFKKNKESVEKLRKSLSNKLNV